MHDADSLMLMRVDRFVRERVTPAVYRETVPVEITAWSVPDEPVPFAAALGKEYRAFAVGDSWGPPWGTVWFHVVGQVPSEWSVQGTRPELVVDLGFVTTPPGFQAEGTAYTPDGVIIKAIEPLNPYVPVPHGAVDVYLEAASNPANAGDFSFAPNLLGDKATAGRDPIYRLNRLELGLLDVQVWEFLQDIWTLVGLVHELPPTLQRRAQILRALGSAIEATDPDDVAGTAADGRAALAGVLAQPAHASAHRVHAVGHAHIDSAWLWPVRESVRKVARTFSNVLALIEDDPEFVFAASSAQHYAWLQEHYPELFERVKAQVAAGRITPAGGMWVESDTNLVGGEAMVRQFVTGKRFFMQQLGVEPLDVWLPDSFGFSAALPQIFAAAGSRWFFTQKLSWNQTNRMPHHTFLWEGIDGTRIFTHFTPADTYNSELSAADLARAERQFAEGGAANTSLIPFGWGDGGGGPTREMLAAAHRTGDLEGSPRTELSSPRRFFEAAEAEYADPPIWSGEMYLELHRGAYTSQARTKRGNRRSEHLLREAELWATLATIRTGEDYPYDLLDQTWKMVLLQQFHDILSGTSIAWVHQEVEGNYEAIRQLLEFQIGLSLARLAGDGDEEVTFNAGPYWREGTPAFGGASRGLPQASIVTEADDGFILENSRVRILVDRRGLIVSAMDLDADREVIPPGVAGNVLQLFRDTPTQWDAWDIDAEYTLSGRELTDAESVGVTDDGRAVRVVRSTGASRIVQELSLHDENGALEILTSVDWRDRQKLLKLAFPFDVHAERAASEIQFGHVYRPTHANTSWDVARFETAAHRWVHAGEPGFGVAVANDATYGHDISRTTLPDGRTATTVRLSLLRAPLYPDPGADQGMHQFRVSVLIGADIAEAIAEGYRLNLSLRQVRGAGPVESLLSVDNPAVVVEAVKLAEDRSGDVIVRLYEAHGSRTSAKLVPGFDWLGVVETDLIERSLSFTDAVVSESEREVDLTLRPFQLVTLRFARA
ncbi:MAG: alpha-mannosidase [Microbacteriaceae bacterium]|nr:alpha-mannosidase [Microbacteriaceae bacterium]